MTASANDMNTIKCLDDKKVLLYPMYKNLDYKIAGQVN